MESIDFNVGLIDSTQVVSSSRRSGIMLCYPFEEKRLAKWKAPYIIQPKLDGVRCRARITPKEVVLISSENHFIDLVPHINQALAESFPNVDMELDGELYTHGMNFQNIISRTSRSKNKHSGSEDIEYHIFDIVSQHLQVHRLSVLLEIEKRFTRPCLKLVRPALVRTMPDIMNKYDEFVANGYEGFVIRDSGGYYQRKRYNGIMKFKPHQTDTYTILDTQEEISINGFPKGTLGAFVCTSNEGTVFSVGTGLTQEQRIQMWKYRDELVGKKLKVKYQALTQGKRVPRFPVALEVIN